MRFLGKRDCGYCTGEFGDVADSAMKAIRNINRLSQDVLAEKLCDPKIHQGRFI